MKVRWILLAAVAVLAPVIATALDAAASELPLDHIADIALPGSTARFDYQSFDATRQRLFIAHMGADEILAVDVETHAVHRIADTPDVHGVLAVPSLGRFYATVTGRDELAAIDADSLKVLATAPTGRYPDGIAYAPAVDKVFVSNELGGSDTVVDVRSNRRIGTIPLGGEVGNTQYDPVSQHIFANVQTENELVEIDPKSERVLARYPIDGARGNHGLLIEPEQHLAFIACEGNSRLIVFDLDAKKVTATFPVGDGPDVLAFDPGLKLLYVAAESGIVSMFREQGRGLVKLGEARLAPAAHSVAVNPKNHDVYFPLKHIGGHPVLRIMRPSPDLR